MNRPWFADPSNVLTLVLYLVDQGEESDNIQYAAEKPWKYEDEYIEAVAWSLDNTQEDEGIE